MMYSTSNTKNKALSFVGTQSQGSSEEIYQAADAYNYTGQSNPVDHKFN